VELALVKLCQLGVAQTMPQTAAPQQPAPAKPAEKPAAPKEQPAPSIPKMPKIGLGFGPKKEAPTNDQSPITNTPPQEEQNRPFTVDQLRDAWVGLAATHKEEPRLKQLIENYMPLMVNDLTAEIQMPNPWQMTEMRKALPNILQQLRSALHNDHLEIQLVQAEFNQEQMAFTADEKYKLMVEQNPALSLLKEKLDLQID
jgi:hypothetical protein